MFACITSLLGVALGTLCGGSLLEAWEGAGWFTGSLDRVKVLILLSAALRLTVVLWLVPRLDGGARSFGKAFTGILGRGSRRK